MASTLDRLLEEALKLGRDERARIVAELLAALDPDMPSQRRSGEEWIREIERRVRAAAAGAPGAVAVVDGPDIALGALAAADRGHQSCRWFCWTGTLNWGDHNGADASRNSFA
jgi:hypothetical protein